MGPMDPTAAPDAADPSPEQGPGVIDQVALARLYGEPLFQLPQDLYIPPDALEVFLEAFEGPLDLLLYLIRRQKEPWDVYSERLGRVFYFPHNGYPVGDSHRVKFSGMPFYDAWTAAQFAAQYGRAMATIVSNDVNVADYLDEAAFLPAVIGNFTNSIENFVRATYSNCRFEVLDRKSVV